MKHCGVLDIKKKMHIFLTNATFSSFRRKLERRVGFISPLYRGAPSKHPPERLYGSGPSITPVEQCRLPAIVPVKSLGTDGNNE